MGGTVRWVRGGEQGGLGRPPDEPSRLLAAPPAEAAAPVEATDTFGLLTSPEPADAGGTNTSRGGRSVGGVGRRRLGRPGSTDPPTLGELVRLNKQRCDVSLSSSCY